MRRMNRFAANRLAAIWALLVACDAEPEPAPDTSEVPRLEYCDVARGWSAEWSEQEAEVLERIASVRAEGIDCYQAGKHGVAPMLRVDGALTCAARVHALAMPTRAFVGHVDPDGTDPAGRAELAGYPGVVVEHWAAGPDDAHALVDELWLRNDSTCADLASRDLVDVGIGHVGGVDDEHSTYWVLVLGSPTPLDD